MWKNTRLLIGLFCGLCAATLTSCGVIEELTQTAEKPLMSYQQTRLIRYPRPERLVAYFCPELLDTGVCGAIVGQRPRASELRFDFRLTFEVTNPNPVPIPATAMMLGVDLFKGRKQSELGAVCVSFCSPGNPNCEADKGSAACRPNDDTINGWDDVALRATAGLLRLATQRTSQAYDENDKRRMIPANGTTNVQVVFSLGVTQMLRIVKTLFYDLADDLIQGRQPEIVIPFSLKGAVWFQLPYQFGRVGLNFGPINSQWSLNDLSTGPQ